MQHQVLADQQELWMHHKPVSVILWTNVGAARSKGSKSCWNPGQIIVLSSVSD